MHEQINLFNNCTIKSKLNVFTIKVQKFHAIYAKFNLVTSLDYYNYLQHN